MEQTNENKDLRSRVFAAADKLYAEAGREDFPTVDAVRREAKAAMGDTSTLMKEWRKAQTSHAVAPAIHTPDAILKTAQDMAAAAWSQAQDMATESLKAAQAAWDAERAEAERMTSEMGDAYDSLEAEHATTTADLANTRTELEKATTTAEQLTADINKAQATIQAQTTQVNGMEADIKALRVQVAEAEKALQTEAKARTYAEKQLAVVETKLAAAQEQSVSIADAHAQTIAAYRDAQSQDRKALEVADARIAALEDQNVQDRKALEQARTDMATQAAQVARLEGELEALRQRSPDTIAQG